jgi:hypothetical protein
MGDWGRRAKTCVGMVLALLACLSASAAWSADQPDNVYAT